MRLQSLPFNLFKELAAQGASAAEIIFQAFAFASSKTEQSPNRLGTQNANVASSRELFLRTRVLATTVATPPTYPVVTKMCMSAAAPVAASTAMSATKKSSESLL